MSDDVNVSLGESTKSRLPGEPGSGFMVSHQGRQKSPEPRRRLFSPAHDVRIVLISLAAGFPAVIVAMTLLWLGRYTAKVDWTLGLVIFGSWIGFSCALRGRVVRPLQTISNLLAALREGDFSIRARGYDRRDTLGDVMAEINELGATLQTQRLGALEATALLGKVVQEIDVAVFAFDGSKMRIPGQVVHLFHSKLSTHSGRSCPVIPVRSCPLFGVRAERWTTSRNGGQHPGIFSNPF